jgi:hypothetical protein
MICYDMTVKHLKKQSERPYGRALGAMLGVGGGGGGEIGGCVEVK